MNHLINCNYSGFNHTIPVLSNAITPLDEFECMVGKLSKNLPAANERRE